MARCMACCTFRSHLMLYVFLWSLLVLN
ncbi:DUF2770 family protein [Bacillus altitudinis]